MPKEFALGAIQDGTQRLASQLRDAGQREERSDYGGQRIESAATDGARLAVRSVEAFLKSGAAALSRNKGEEPPPDDLPFDETAPQETAPGTDAAPVAEELPATEYPLLESNAPAEPLPLPASGAEYPAPKLPESPVTRTETPSPNLSEALPKRADIGDSRVTVKTKENPTLARQLNSDGELVKEREALPTATR